MKVEGYTARELAEQLGITYVNVRHRISLANVEPLTKDAIYPLDTLEKIRNVAPVGRPPRKAEQNDEAGKAGEEI
jgi:hypothetical protein